jgi:hypothetical protein
VLSALAVDYLFLPPFGSILSSVTAVVCVPYFTFVAGLICYLQEKNKRIAAELRSTVGITEAALKEKEVLLRELQHRVKNNLQIIGRAAGMCATWEMQTGHPELGQEEPVERPSPRLAVATRRPTRYLATSRMPAVPDHWREGAPAERGAAGGRDQSLRGWNTDGG